MNDLLALLPLAGLTLVAITVALIVWRQEHPRPKHS